MKIKIMGVFLVASMQLSAYKIQIQNTLDGVVTVNITEGEVTTPYTVRPNDFFKHNTRGCYMLMLVVASGKATGQSAGIGSVFNKTCRDYTAIARFTQEPSWDPIKGQQVLDPKIMELAEQ